MLRFSFINQPSNQVPASHWIALLIALLFVALCLANPSTVEAQDKADETANNQPIKYAIAIHGGAGSNPKIFSKEANEKRRASMKQALTIGANLLKKGGSSLDAVEKVIRFLEDDPQFNAGKGAVANSRGGHELDASIMSGKDKACGAVAAVTTVKNPISLARRVMTETPHVLLTGPGADTFAKQMEVELVGPDYFRRPASPKKQDRESKKVPSAPANSAVEQSSKNMLSKNMLSLDKISGSYLGTVGCVALDQSGNLAAGTSTGGLGGKKFGRVGDSPIIGAGTYADNETCAVSCTGKGEQFIRYAIAYDISARIKYNKQTLQSAVKENLQSTINPGEGGIIAISKDGEITMQFNTGGMARAAADSNGKFEVLWNKSQMESEVKPEQH